MRENIPYEITKDIVIKLNNSKVDFFDKQETLIYDIKMINAHPNILDGNIGFHFFREIKGSVLFDFKYMFIDIIEQEVKNLK